MNQQGTQTSTQTAQPWGPIGDAYKTGLTRAENLYQQGPYSFYPGETQAGYGATTQQALGQTQQLAGQGGTVAPLAQDLATQQLGGQYLQSNPAFDYLGATARGEMVGQNPYLDAQVSRAQQSVADMTNAQFAGSGRTNSAYHAGTLGRNLGDVASSMYGGAYGQERALQQQAAGALGGLYGDERNRMQQTMFGAGGIDAQRYADARQLLGVGKAQDALRQAQINADMQRYGFEQQAPADQLSRYFGYVKGTPMLSGSTTSKPTYASPGLAVMSGAGSGATLASALGVSPWIGALGGGMLGYGSV